MTHAMKRSYIKRVTRQAHKLNMNVEHYIHYKTAKRLLLESVAIAVSTA